MAIQFTRLTLTLTFIIPFLFNQKLNSAKLLPSCEYAEKITTQLSKKRSDWQDTEEGRNKNNLIGQKFIIETLAKRKDEFCKNNKTTLSLIPNDWIKHTLKNTIIADEETVDIEIFDKMAHQGAKLAYNLLTQKKIKEYTTPKEYLHAIKTLFIFFYIHSIRPRKDEILPCGFQLGTFIIRGEYPLLKDFLKKYRIFIKKKYPKNYQSFIKPLSFKSKELPLHIIYDLYLTESKDIPLFKKFRSLRVTERENYVKIEPRTIGTGSIDDLLESKFIEYNKNISEQPDTCDIPYLLPYNILNAASAAFSLSKFSTPFKISDFYDAAQNDKKTIFLNKNAPDKNIENFMKTLYTSGQDYYACHLTERSGNECILGQETLISAFFRRMRPKDNKIDCALQGLFIELLEIKKIYRDTLLGKYPIKSCRKQMRIFSDHASIMAPHVKDKLVREYLLNLALITRYQVFKKEEVRFGILFDSENQKNLIKNAAENIIAEIIATYACALFCTFKNETSFQDITKDALNELMDTEAPFDHPIFSQEKGLLKNAQRIMQYYGNPSLIAPILGLIQGIHDISKSINKEDLYDFCSLALKLWEKQAIPWIEDVHKRLNLTPLKKAHYENNQYNQNFQYTYSLKPEKEPKTQSTIVTEEKIEPPLRRCQSFKKPFRDDN